MFVFNIFIQVIGLDMPSCTCLKFRVSFWSSVSRFVQNSFGHIQVKLKVEDLKLSGRQFAADLPKNWPRKLIRWFVWIYILMASKSLHEEWPIKHGVTWNAGVTFWGSSPRWMGQAEKNAFELVWIPDCNNRGDENFKPFGVTWSYWRVPRFYFDWP